MSDKITKNDSRKVYLTRMVSRIFGVKGVEFRKTENGESEVVRGNSKKLGDCTFTQKYYNYYEELFKLTFADKKIIFAYEGKRDAKRNYSRDAAIKNAISFLGEPSYIDDKKMPVIDISYEFYDASEKYLFSKYIYTIIKGILNVVFSVDKGDDLYNNLKKHYLKRQKELDEIGIITLIYKSTTIKDMAVIYDKNVEKTNVNRAFCLRLHDLNKFEIDNLSSLGFSKSSKIWMDKKYDYPYKSIKFEPEINNDQSFFNLHNKKNRIFFFPSYCMFCTSSEIENIYDPQDELSSYCINAAYSAFNSSFSSEVFAEYKKHYLSIFYSDIVKVLQKLGQINYNRFFLYDFYNMKEDFTRFKIYLERNNFDAEEVELMFVHSVTVGVENLCLILKKFISDESNIFMEINVPFDLLYSSINKGSEEYKKFYKNISSIAESKWLATAENEFENYYGKNFNEIGKIRKYLGEKTGFHSMNFIDCIYMESNDPIKETDDFQSEKSDMNQTTNDIVGKEKEYNCSDTEEGDSGNNNIKGGILLDQPILPGVYNPYKWLKDILFKIKKFIRIILVKLINDYEKIFVQVSTVSSH